MRSKKQIAAVIYHQKSPQKWLQRLFRAVISNTVVVVFYAPARSSKAARCRLIPYRRLGVEMRAVVGQVRFLVRERFHVPICVVILFSRSETHITITERLPFERSLHDHSYYIRCINVKKAPFYKKALLLCTLIWSPPQTDFFKGILCYNKLRKPPYKIKKAPSLLCIFDLIGGLS